MADLREELRHASNDARSLGIVLILMGAIPLLMVLDSGSAQSLPARVYAIVTTVTLLGPGVWYVVAARLMRKLNPYVAQVSIRIVLAQLAIVAICLAIGFLDLTPRVGRDSVSIPACMAVFQIPALIALLFPLRRARRIIKQLEPEGFAFETIPVAQIAEKQPADQRTESERAK